MDLGTLRPAGTSGAWNYVRSAMNIYPECNVMLALSQCTTKMNWTSSLMYNEIIRINFGWTVHKFPESNYNRKFKGAVKFLRHSYLTEQ